MLFCWLHLSLRLQWNLTTTYEAYQVPESIYNRRPFCLSARDETGLNKAVDNGTAQW